MIITESFEQNGRTIIHTYSDAGRYVVRDGVEYLDACDPAELGRTYTEGSLIADTDVSDVTADEIAAALEEIL